ncbi:MAG: diacylglycerol kinase, partial [Candidatus Uhrbacteria bacterium]
HIRPWEWAVLVIVSGSVLVLECCNSAMERLIDLLKPRLHGYVKEVKDVMAGAVLIASLVAVAVGVVIFAPYILRW